MKVNQEVIDLLKEAVTKAEAGEIQGFVMVTAEPRNVVGQLIGGKLRMNDLIGGLEFAKRDLMNQGDELKKGELDIK